MDKVMTVTKRHPVVAFLIDGYLLESLLNIIYKPFNVELKFQLGIGIVFFVLFLTYHMKYYSKTAFLTPGELFTAAFLDSDRVKVYLNPFNRNRIVLWASMLLSLIVAKSPELMNSFSSSAAGLLTLTGITVYVYCSFILYNRGHFAGLIMSAVLFLVQAAYVMMYKQPFVKGNDTAMFLFSTPLVFLAVFTAYWLLNLAKKEK